MHGKIGIVFLVVVMLFSAVAFVGCRSSGPTVLRIPPTTVERYDFSSAITVGNRSYFPLNIGGDPSDHIGDILGALSAFEKAHPELEVTGWHIEKQQVGYANGAFIFGIWVDHRSAR